MFWFNKLVPSISSSVACHAGESCKASAVLPAASLHTVLYILIRKDFPGSLAWPALEEYIKRGVVFCLFFCLRRACKLFFVCQRMVQYVHRVYTYTWTHRCRVGSKSLSPLPNIHFKGKLKNCLNSPLIFVNAVKKKWGWGKDFVLRLPRALLKSTSKKFNEMFHLAPTHVSFVRGLVPTAELNLWQLGVALMHA